jgi:hypothetical protein
MKHYRFSLAAAAIVSLSVLVGISVPCTGSEIHKTTAADNTYFSPTVLPGSPVRKAILDALRQEMKRLHSMDMVFVVKYMKVKDKWCWVHTLPQSADGMNHYEDVSALLHREGSVWKVAELACTEEENPECLSNPKYFKILKTRFPEVREEIFPME